MKTASFQSGHRKSALRPAPSPPSLAARLTEADTLLERGDVTAAEAAYTSMLADQPETGAILCKLGFLLLDQQRREEAHGKFLLALAAEPGLSLAYLGLANIYQLEGRAGEALTALEAGRSIDVSFDRYDGHIEELRLLSLDTPPARILVADGTEDDDGRALFLISALHHAAQALGRTRVRFMNVSNDAVRAAIEVLAWDCGIEVEVLDAGCPVVEALQSAVGFAAVSFRESQRLLEVCAQAEGAGLRCLVALQFPGSNPSATDLILSHAAHDPAALAAHITDILDSR
jgi:tetratricopeptide (TPR) repeat protein